MNYFAFGIFQSKFTQLYNLKKSRNIKKKMTIYMILRIIFEKKNYLNK